jgi:hypothetical protein
MTVHTELTPAEAADRLALCELFDAYAHRADRRDAEGQKALFTDDTRFAVYMDGEGSTARLHRRRHPQDHDRPSSVISTPSPRTTAAGTSPNASSSSTGAKREP